MTQPTARAILASGYINPLTWTELELPVGLSIAPASCEQIVDYLCSFGIPSDQASLETRYREITASSASLAFAPAHRRILQKLITPLYDAKSSYVLGNYLGTIALAGLVAEMLAILLYNTADIHLHTGQPTTDRQHQLYGRSFEKLGQERRVSVLQGLGLIEPDQVVLFDRIRDVRRKYLHLLSEPHERLAEDARVAFGAALELTRAALGDLDPRVSAVVNMRPGLLKYLQDEGLVIPIATLSP